MRTSHVQSILIWVLRVLLASVFILAAVGKARAEPGEAQTIYDAWLKPGSVGHSLFIAGEFALAMWLLTGWRPHLAAATAGALLIVFSITIWREMRQYAPRPCGCLGGRIEPMTPQDVRGALRASLVRNLVLIAAAGWLVVVPAQATTRRSDGGKETERLRD